MATNKQPTRKINRVMIDAKKDSFYGSGYNVHARTSLNYFDPVKNSNKFYIAEVHGSVRGYRFYANYGRVGAKGVENAKPCKTLDEALATFKKKVREKLIKGYVEVELATFSKGSAVGKNQINIDGIKGVVDVDKIATKTSKLHPKVQEFVTKIYDEANQAVSLSMSGSVKTNIKAPLGNLGINGINRGRELLRQISHALSIGDINFVRYASIDYYRHVPRKLPSNVRDESTWILNTIGRLTKEMEILDLYEDSLRMLPLIGISDIDAKYNGLNCDIIPVEDSNTLNYINLKVKNTHASNHRFKLRVINAYEINHKNAPQLDRSVGNVVKLFHGSRSANLVGILSSCLRIPTSLGSNVIKTGAMFGDGIYLADSCTKSWNYSKGSWQRRPNKYNTAFLFICETAMGRVYKTDTPEYFTKAPAGYDSVMGCRGKHLINNEFIVYKENQVRIKYIVECEEY